MVSAAKLKKAQRAIENSIPYVSKLYSIINNFVTSLEGDNLPALAEVREEKNVAIIVISSNSSLCGAFNSNALKAFKELYDSNKKKGTKKGIVVYPVGKKISESLTGLKIKQKSVAIDTTHELNYASVANFVEKLMSDFIEKRIDKVVVIYNHFKNTGVQEIRCEELLPFSPKKLEASEMNTNIDYIIEPDPAELVTELLPKVVKLNLYSMLQDSLAAEHAARTTAMQVATDNADDLIQELKLNYNKMRQSAITNEIITIIGGAEAIQ